MSFLMIFLKKKWEPWTKQIETGWENDEFDNKIEEVEETEIE